MKVPSPKFCLIKLQHIRMREAVNTNPVSLSNLIIFFGVFIVFENFIAPANAQNIPGTLTSPDYTYTPDPYGGAGVLDTPSGQTWAQPTMGGGFEATAPDGSTVIYTPDGPRGGEIDTTPAPDADSPDISVPDLDQDSAPPYGEDDQTQGDGDEPQ